MAAATSSTRATKINAPTFTSGRKYSRHPSPPLQPSPRGRERLQPQNILLIILLRHAQRDRTIRSPSDELVHQRIRRPLDLLWCPCSDNPPAMQHDHFMRNAKGAVHVVRDHQGGNPHLVREVGHELIDDPTAKRIRGTAGP